MRDRLGHGDEGRTSLAGTRTSEGAKREGCVWVSREVDTTDEDVVPFGVPRCGGAPTLPVEYSAPPRSAKAAKGMSSLAHSLTHPLARSLTHSPHPSFPHSAAPACAAAAGRRLLSLPLLLLAPP